jgi:hypothetical protein
MTQPIDPAVADAALRAQLAEQAAAAAPPTEVPNIDVSAAKAADLEALLSQLRDLQARAQEAVDAATPVPEPPDTSLRVDSNAPGWMHSMVAVLEGRLSAVEAKLGIGE